VATFVVPFKKKYYSVIAKVKNNHLSGHFQFILIKRVKKKERIKFTCSSPFVLLSEREDD
jgi:hypothetical protein